MEEKIKLSDLLGTCLEFKQNPTSENMAKVNEIISKFQIATYLPLKQKEIILVIILNNCTTKDTDSIATEINLSIAKTIYGILSYVVNLENDLDFAAFDFGAIDMLYEMEIIDNILKACNADYQRLEKMIEETINFGNLVRLAELANLMTPENIDKFVETVNDMKTELTPEKLKDLKDLANAGSPEFEALKETVVDEVLGRVLDQDFNTLAQNDKRKTIKKKIQKEEQQDKEKIEEPIEEIKKDTQA